MFRPLELYVGLKYTRAKRRNHFISFISSISMGGIALAFIPPSQSDMSMPAWELVPIVAIGFAVTLLLPFIFYQFRNPKWARTSRLPKADETDRDWPRGD